MSLWFLKMIWIVVRVRWISGRMMIFGINFGGLMNCCFRVGVKEVFLFLFMCFSFKWV